MNTSLSDNSPREYVGILLSLKSTTHLCYVVWRAGLCFRRRGGGLLAAVVNGGSAWRQETNVNNAAGGEKAFHPNTQSHSQETRVSLIDSRPKPVKSCGSACRRTVDTAQHGLIFISQKLNADEQEKQQQKLVSPPLLFYYAWTKQTTRASVSTGLD